MNLTVTMKAEALLARVAGSHDRLIGNLRVVVSRWAIKLQGLVKADKLTGQVLHVRTGTLRRSINQMVFETAQGIFGRVGTNVSYAAVHEYGFDGIVNVRAHVRKMHGNEVNVRSHPRQMHVAKRSFLLSTLNEHSDEIRMDLRQAITRAVRP